MVAVDVKFAVLVVAILTKVKKEVASDEAFAEETVELGVGRLQIVAEYVASVPAHERELELLPVLALELVLELGLEPVRGCGHVLVPVPVPALVHGTVVA